MNAVKLYVYDLSQGMARAMSMAYIGRQIDAIWHTSVVVYGTEYFFGAGICQASPGQTHHGHPLEIVEMGTTSVSREQFLAHLAELRRGKYSDTAYHLLHNNCNSFTNDVCQFLVQRPIPAKITSLPSDFLSTPLGRMLEPTINQMFTPLATQRPPMTAAPSPLSPAVPPHPHASIAFDTTLVLKDGFWSHLGTFAPPHSVAPIFAKLKQFAPVSSNPVVSQLEKLLTSTSYVSFPINAIGDLSKLIFALPFEHVFPLLDLLRIMVLKKECQKDLASKAGITLLLKCVNNFGYASLAESKSVPASTMLLAFRLLANSLSVPALSAALMSPNPSYHIDGNVEVPPVEVITEALLSNILESSTHYSKAYAGDAKVQHAISTCVFNLSLLACHGRSDKQLAFTFEDNFAIEIVSVIVHMLSQHNVETNDQEEVTQRYLVALLFFLYKAPNDVIELARVLDLKDVCSKLATVQRFRLVCGDLVKAISV